MTFKEVIEAEKANLEALEVELMAVMEKELADVELKHKQAVKDIKFKLKRLDAALSIFQEQEALFNNYIITEKEA